MENKIFDSVSRKTDMENVKIIRASTKPLTKEMIALKCKTENLTEIKNINMWGNELDNLAILREMPNVEIVSLSLNKVSTLREFAYCKKVQEIYLRKNCVFDLQEVLHLSALPKLRLLMLQHNPCASHPYYRPFVLRKLPGLTRLDNADVKSEERIAANKINFDQIFKENPSFVQSD